MELIIGKDVAIGLTEVLCAIPWAPITMALHSSSYCLVGTLISVTMLHEMSSSEFISDVHDKRCSCVVTYTFISHVTKMVFYE